MHTEALRRHDFDSVLTPVNYRLASDPAYRSDLEVLLDAAGRADAAVMAIKAIARRTWRDGEEKRYDTWYAPFDEQRYITAALAWLLATYPQVTGFATAGETRLLRQMIAAEAASEDMSPDEAAVVLDEVRDYASPFVATPG